MFFLVQDKIYLTLLIKIIQVQNLKKMNIHITWNNTQIKSFQIINKCSPTKDYHNH